MFPHMLLHPHILNTILWSRRRRILLQRRGWMSEQCSAIGYAGGGESLSPNPDPQAQPQIQWTETGGSYAPYAVCFLRHDLRILLLILRSSSCAASMPCFRAVWSAPLYDLVILGRNVATTLHHTACTKSQKCLQIKRHSESSVFSGVLSSIVRFVLSAASSSRSTTPGPVQQPLLLSRARFLDRFHRLFPEERQWSDPLPCLQGQLLLSRTLFQNREAVRYLRVLHGRD